MQIGYIYSPLNKARAKKALLELARRNNISLVPTSLDLVADKFSELSGDEVNSDEVLAVSVSLARSGVLTKIDALKLAHEYLRRA